MHDDFQELEAELKRLRPRGASPRLLERIDQAMDAPAALRSSAPYKTATTWRSWKWAVWSGAVAAALAAGVFTFRSAERVTPTKPTSSVVAATAGASSAVAADIYKPVRADNVLAGEQEERITLADGTPARRVRAQYVDTITWTNPRTNASLRWSVPREEVRVVPVLFQ